MRAGSQTSLVENVLSLSMCCHTYWSSAALISKKACLAIRYLALEDLDDRISELD
jgi:hypothetical protein